MTKQSPKWFPSTPYFQDIVLTVLGHKRELTGIRHMNGKTKITWIHFAFDWHEVVTANGCFSETHLLGPMVVSGLTRRECRDLIEIFGAPKVADVALNGPPART